MHSTVGFSVKHMMVSTVHGKFTKFTGTLEVDDQNPANDKLSVDIDANSIDTGNEKRDGHLKTADFLDTAKFPKITYVSKSVKSLGPGKLEVKGDLHVARGHQAGRAHGFGFFTRHGESDGQAGASRC